jgi:peptide/nickel transport system permease protein
VSAQGAITAPPAARPSAFGRLAKPRGEWAIIWRQLRRNRSAMLGATILTILLLVAIFAPLVAPYDPLDQNPTAALKPPSGTYYFGTDDTGRDIFSRVVYGTRISLRIGLLSVGIGGLVGIALGVIAGYRRGLVDDAIMRLMDLMLAFPALLLALAVIAILGPGLFNAMIAIGIANIPIYTRVARGTTLSLRERDFVLGARTIGCRDSRIMARYILPNVLPPLIVLATLGIAGAILTAAGLSYIGLGAKPPSPEWGAMLTRGRNFLQQAWWYSTFPGLAIMITVLGINMLGDALRDALDPRLRR